MKDAPINEQNGSARGRRTGSPRNRHTQAPRHRAGRSRHEETIPCGEFLVRSKDPRCPKCGGAITFFAGCGRRKVPCCDPCGVCFPRNFLENVALVRPLPASGEDELGVMVQITEDASNTAAGSGLHEATCSPNLMY